ncbi:hypothetical protein CGJ36_07915 [Vibrio parahaemolyticus]|uniref:capsular polysaccharide export protein, LipB/KpsS family n=1 Tax=Vibrio parahaemolyticus TaxID=670 RepID=UPI001124B0AB|nr:hypothetical protein [Vibrio parahaemolyticus]TOE77581.1 hypothetical protein CGJ36_07915 [Vibrio parahaemolyticus]
MKLLFATEVFPMRNSFTEHSLVSREFLTNIGTLLKQDNCVSDARILCNNPTFDMLVKDYAELLPSFIRLREDTSISLNEMIQDWANGGISSWKDYVDNKGSGASLIYQELEHIYNNVYKFDMVICWGENGVYDQFAKDVNIPCLHMELSSTRAPFSENRIGDLLGANGSSSIKNISFKDLDKAIQAPSYHFWQAAYNINGESNSEKLGFDDSSSTYWTEDYTLNIPFQSKTALVGLQLFDDANTQRHSDYQSPLDFLQEILPKLSDAGWEIIVKTHPGAIHRPINYLHQKDAIDYAKTFDNCYIYDHKNDGRDYLSLLKSVDLVVSINSSLGFESAMLGKVSVVCGQALYKVDGVFPTLDSALDQKFDKEDYLRKISSLTYFYNKYVFLDKSVFSRGEFYKSYLEFWSNHGHEIEAGSYPIGNYIKCFERYANSFLSEGGINLEDFESIPVSLLTRKTKSRENITEKDGYILFKDSLKKIELSKGTSKYALDRLSIDDNILQFEGWCMDSFNKIPPALILIVADGKLLHYGRAVVKRGDVKDFVKSTHEHYGFKYKLNLDSVPNDISLIFVYPSNKADIIRIM